MEFELGEHRFKASLFTFGQAIEAHQPIKDVGSGDLELQIKGACALVALAISEHHPEMTAERVRAIRSPLPPLFKAATAILRFNEYEFAEPGKAPAAAATA
jgi:hypothetical protein